MESPMPLTLYGTPLSLYTGKARAYLIKAEIPYREITIADPHYREVVLPKAGTGSIPTIEMTDGSVIRDGTQIIEHFESQNGPSFLPNTPRQKIVSLLFDVIGSEGLLRPAMHFRWNFPEENQAFLTFHFGTNIPVTEDRGQKAEATMDRMRNAGVMFGATPDNFETLEKLYDGFLEHFNQHVATHPYLLGTKPCTGDFGLIAPLYAHLGRDPYPLNMMQKKAIRVFRWVERMNRPEPDIGEYDGIEPDRYLPDDEIPDSLIQLMQHIAIDFIPETTAAASFINDWLATENPEPGTPVQRGVGLCEFECEGATFKALAQPYRFYLLARLQHAFQALPETEQQTVRIMMEAGGMADVLDIKLNRALRFENNREVWV